MFSGKITKYHALALELKQKWHQEDIRIVRVVDGVQDYVEILVVRIPVKTERLERTKTDNLVPL